MCVSISCIRYPGRSSDICESHATPDIDLVRARLILSGACVLKTVQVLCHDRQGWATIKVLFDTETRGVKTFAPTFVFERLSTLLRYRNCAILVLLVSSRVACSRSRSRVNNVIFFG